MISRGQWMVAKKKLNDALEVWMWVFIMMGFIGFLGWLCVRMVANILSKLISMSFAGLMGILI